MPLYHINGQIVTAVAPLVHGGSVVMPHRFSASGYWELVAKHRCTWINVVPTIIAYLLNGPDPRAQGLDISRVKFCRSASAPLPPDLHLAFERKFGIGIIETFGMTETNAPCFTNPLDPAKRKIGSPGPAYGNEAKTIDTQTGRTLPPGIAGEIMVRGDNVMTCYYKDPEATAKTLEPDGWMHTGDVGYLDADGYLYLTDRKAFLIISGGVNVYPQEAENVLVTHPKVVDVAVFGVPNEDFGEEVKAVVEPASMDDAGPELERELIAYCREHLADVKCPRSVDFRPELPRHPTGKLYKRLLKDEYWKGHDTRI
jgi:long-chain acyl-CoA synthetase